MVRLKYCELRGFKNLFPRGSYLNQTNYVIEFHQRLLQFQKKVFDQTGFSRFLDDLNTNNIDSAADYSFILLTKDKTEINELINSYLEVKATDIFYIDQLKSRKKSRKSINIYSKRISFRG